jgi:hypothetical protein
MDVPNHHFSALNELKKKTASSESRVKWNELKKKTASSESKVKILNTQGSFFNPPSLKSCPRELYKVYGVGGTLRSE